MTVQINHHIVITDEEQNMIVNALAFFHEHFKYSGAGHRAEVVRHWQVVADDTRLQDIPDLENKIATSN